MSRIGYNKQQKIDTRNARVYKLFYGKPFVNVVRAVIGGFVLCSVVSIYLVTVLLELGV